MDWSVKWELGGGRGLLTGDISDNLFLENNLFKNQADLN